MTEENNSKTKKIHLRNEKGEILCNNLRSQISEHLGHPFMSCRRSKDKTEKFKSTDELIDFMDKYKIIDEDYNQALDLSKKVFSPTSLTDDSTDLGRGIYGKSKKRKI